MHPARFLGLVSFALLTTAAIYALTLLLLARATRPGTRRTRAVMAVRRGHLVVLRQVPDDKDERGSAQSRYERRNKGV